MKKNEIKIGHLYMAKVSNRMVRVRIDSVNSRGGWNATNTLTGKRIRIRSAQRLRYAVAEPEHPVNSPADQTTEPKRMSALDAAAQILAETGKAMNVRELLTIMAERDLWSSPRGKTPHATLHAGIIREIARKGDTSRFRRAGRGLFVHNAQ